MPSLPSPGTTSVTCFTIGSNAYVLTWALSYNQFWQYSFRSNTWTRKKDFPGAPRCFANSIAINGKGYLGLGEQSPEDSQYWHDWWQYDPITDAWTPKADLEANGRWGAVSFASSTKAYICGGMNMFQGYFNDCWEYDPTADTWAQQASLPASGRAYAVGMSTPAAGIVGTGYNGTTSLSDVWQFNFTTKAWSQTLSLYSARHGAAGIAVGDILFIGGGRSGNPGENPTDIKTTLDDWRFLYY
jgi:N-acetylneuraminic acid mutarotase